MTTRDSASPDLRLHVLGTGSKGNASVIEAPEGLILVDCGLSCKQILVRMGALGLDPAGVQAILITHEHSDHIAGLRVTAKKLRAPVCASEGTILSDAWPSEVAAQTLEVRKPFILAGARITAFHVPHDAAETVGYRFEAGQEAISFCTDIGCVTEEAGENLHDATVLALESNHDTAMLRDYAGYPAYLKARIGSDHGHLSNEQAADALGKLVTGRTRSVVGMHISQHTNLPSVAREALDGANEPVRILIGSQTTPMSV